MTDIALFNKIKAGGFLPLQLTIDPLQSILIEIMQLIKNQSTRINKLEDGKADKEELKLLENTVDNNQKESSDKISALQSQLERIESSIKDVKEIASNSMEKGLDAKNSALAAENKANEIINTVNSINDKLESIDNNQCQIERKLDEQQIEVDNLKKQINDIQNLLGGKSQGISSSLQGNSEELEEFKARISDLEDATQHLASNISNIEERKANKSDLEKVEKEIRNIEEQLWLIGEPSTFERNSNEPFDTEKMLLNCVKKDELLRLANQIKDLSSQVDLIKSELLPKHNDSDTKDAGENLDQLKTRINDLERRLNQNNNSQEYKPRPPSESSSGRTSVRDTKLDDDRIKLIEDKLRQQIENYANNDSLADEINKLKEEIGRIKTEVDARPDKALIERLFEKFKESMNGVINMINEKQKPESNTATIDDIKRLEKLIKSITQEFDEAAAARKCTKCLSCGKGFRTVAGSIQDSETAQLLGAAPISHVVSDKKPCFVYGSDHELYYSVSPRGRSFVVTGRKASTSDGVRPPASTTK